MALHPTFPSSPYAPLLPELRWFPADETLRATAYEKLLPPLVAKIRKEVFAWRSKGYAGASETSKALLRWWFETEHLTENADGSLSTFRYYFAQREAVETVIWLYDVKHARDKFDLLRFASRLEVGETIQILVEINNPVTRIAVTLVTDDYKMIGWAPRYLVSDIINCVPNAPDVSATIARVNDDAAPLNQRFLIDYRGKTMEGMQPMSTPDFKPLLD